MAGAVMGDYANVGQANTEEFRNRPGGLLDRLARLERYDAALRRIEEFGHGDGHGCGFTCAEFAAEALGMPLRRKS